MNHQSKSQILNQILRPNLISSKTKSQIPTIPN